MEFLNIGLGELLFIALIALVVLGPERLPEMMRRLGRVTGQIRALSAEFQRQLDEETRDLRQPFDEARREVEGTIRPLREARDEVDGALAPLREARDGLKALSSPQPRWPRPPAQSRPRGAVEEEAPAPEGGAVVVEARAAEGGDGA